MGFFSRLFDPGKKTRQAGAAAAAEGRFQDFNVSGPGGTAGFDVSSGNVNVGLDPQMQALQQSLFGQAGAQQFAGAGDFNQLTQVGQGAIGGLGTVGAPSPFQLQTMAGTGAPGQPSLPGQPGVPGTAALPQFQQFNPFSGGPFDPNRGLARGLNQAAMGFLPAAAQGIEGAEQQALSRLRAQARPFEQQQMSDLNERLFGTGQGAVTGSADVELGGGRLAQAFARGLGQADLDRQTQAQGLAIQRRGAEQSSLTGLLGASQGVQGVQESLRQGLFGRQLGAGQFQLGQQGQQFGQALQGAQFGENQLQSLFGRQLGQQQLGLQAQGQNFQQGLAAQGFNNQALQQAFGIQQGLFGAGQGLQSQNIQNQLALTQQGLALNQLPLQLFGLGLNAQTSRSNAALGQAGALTNIAAATPNPALDLAGGAMGMFSLSDRRMKDNLTEIMKDDATGLPIYVWQWNDVAKSSGLSMGPPIGLVAQEVQELYPDAVTEIKGYLHINYRKLIEQAGV